MPRITIENLSGKTIESTGNSEKLLEVLLTATDWMHACGAKGRCTTCKVLVVSGMENLGADSEAEIRYRAMNRLAPHERLACQVIPTGDVTIRVAEEYKLPHIRYSN
jgi:ferredoxin, 2Fe-2S